MWNQPSQTRPHRPRSSAPGITTLIEFEVGPDRGDSRHPSLGHRQKSPTAPTGRSIRMVVTWPLAQVARISPPPKRPPPEPPAAPEDG